MFYSAVRKEVFLSQLVALRARRNTVFQLCLVVMMRTEYTQAAETLIFWYVSPLQHSSFHGTGGFIPHPCNQ